MASEQTPLITTIRVGAPRRRYPHSTLRRFCTIALFSSLICLFITFLFDLGARWAHGIRHGRHDDWRWPVGHHRKVSYEQLKEILMETPSGKKAEEWQRYYTAGAHLAGQNYSQALWTKDKWQEWGVDSRIDAYDIWLNRPVSHRLALLEEKRKSERDTSSPEYKTTFEASLTEDVLNEDPTSGFKNRIPTFHGYSASGNVTAPYVYVNYGTYQDFDDLIKANVSLEGNIALVRYGGIFRGLKAKRAQELGMVGCVLFTDPGDDGGVTEEKGFKNYPNGPARQPSSAQRGSMQFLSVAPGDPTTPGYPSKPGVPRGPVDKYVPSIPSIPISYQDAVPILKALNGHGPKSKEFNKYWTRNEGLGYKGIKYNIGPTPDSVVLNLNNQQEYITTPNWDVIGIINGSIPDEVVVVGNHRDAWIVGGAGDPNSGSAVLNEVIRSFGVALSKGWKPLRTIVFASWDGEEYGLLGSTEWVEEFLPWLKEANVAYLNVDVAVRGQTFKVSSAPLLNGLLDSILPQVQSPNQTVKGQTVHDAWDKKISTMGSGSDFTAFQDHAGIPSMDLGFAAGPNDPVYHYHSNYDSFTWMQKYGDPGFVYHRTMSQVLGLMTAKLADEPLLAFGASTYASSLRTYVDKVKERLSDSVEDVEDWSESDLTEDGIVQLRGSVMGTDSTTEGSFNDFRESLMQLHNPLLEFVKQAKELDEEAKHLRAKVQKGVPWWKWPMKIKLAAATRKVNIRYKNLERAFLYEGGLDGRSWFKHVVFAPGIWTGYAGAVFPGLMESIDARNYTNGIRWVDIVVQCINKATLDLQDT